MFAFCLYDKRRNKFLIGRDRLGIKPIYYSSSADWFIFSSEIKAFYPFPEFEASLDYESLHQYLTFRYVPSPKTIFKNVHKLPAGSILELKFPGLNHTISKYWDISYEKTISDRSLSDIADELGHLIKDAVKIRLMAEVPVGIMLSGGVDSSAIVSAMRDGSHNAISTFTVDYNEVGSHNESYFAKLTSKKYDTEHHEIIISFENFMSNIERMVYFMDEMIGDPAAIPIFELCRFSKQFVTVLLTGVGGDELFAGYKIYKEAVYHNYLNHIPDFIWSFILSPIYRKMPEGTLGKNFVKRVRQPIEESFLGSSFVYGGLSEKEKFVLYKKNIAEYVSGYNSQTKIKKILAQLHNTSRLNKMLYIDTKQWLSDSHLVMMDKMSMGNSIELRTPFLDHRLVEYAASIPEKYKINLRRSKIIFKKALQNDIPAKILNRSKRGFSTPFDRWIISFSWNIVLKSFFKNYF
jgi:asparagine synthase (glutamine-hydrolysing)